MLTFLKSKKDRTDDAVGGALGVQSGLALHKISFPTVDGDLELIDIMHNIKPRNDLTPDMNAWKVSNLENINRGLTKILKAKEFEIATFYGSLWAKHYHNDQEVDYGLVSLRVVTNNGVGFIVDAFQNSVELENMKYHGLGTGTGAESATDSALGTELTTQYNNSGDVRATGTTTEGATANIYRTVATNALDGSAAVTEHGIFSASSSGVLLDRSVFSAINLVSGDSLQTTYDLTFTAGS